MKYIVLFTIFISTFTYGQTFNVSGTVTDKGVGTPIPGVNVIVRGTTSGTSTDFDGNFSLSNVPNNAVLVFSYIGYRNVEVTVNSDRQLNIQLEEDAESLDEVVVIGYGTQTKKEITGAVGIVSSETIETLKPTRIEQALQGQVAGVQISSNSGSPGSSSTITIRGISTNGDSRPLILVDGNVIEDLSVLNPNDIESVNVLKDATAGIYGVRAANGVILITTKSGRKSMPLTFAYDAYTGFQTTTRELPALNATEYALLVNEAYAANGEGLVFPNVSNLGVGTDYQDLVFKTAAVYDHNLTAKGGGEKSTYSVGGGYLSQDGIVGGDKSNFTRITGRGSYSLEFLENFKLDLGLLYANTERSTLAETGLGSVLFNALNMAPTFPVRNPDGSFSIAEGLGNEVINPIAQIENTYNEGTVNKYSGNGGLGYTFLEHFTAQANFQFNYAEVENFVFNPVAFYGSGKVFNRDRSEVVVNNSIFRDYTFDAFLKYENKFNDIHNLNVLLGTSVFKTTGLFSGSVGFDIPDNDVSNANLDQASDIQNLFPNGNATFDSRLLSYFARVQYDYAGKYLFSAVVRRDGSTKFGPENKFGYFPSGSIGWVVSDEDFFGNGNTFNFLKFRASYGILGNDRIPDYRFVSLLNGEGVYVLNDELVFGNAIGSVSNPQIRWEKQKTFDVGLDARFFDNQIDITADYFKRRTEDLLVVPQVSGLLGAGAPGSGAPVINAGEVENSGFEFAIGYSQNLGEKSNLNIKYNVTFLDNKTISVSGDDDFIAGGSFGVGQDPPSRFEAGFPIGYFRGYVTDGIFQNQAELSNYPTLNNTVQVGDLRFVDINNDGLINDMDKTNIGQPLPTSTMGLNISLDINNFDIGAYAFAQLGNDIVRNYERNQQLTNRSSYYLDRFTGEGTSNSFPRVTSGANTNSLFSDFYVEDGSFVRLQNVQLGYSLPARHLENIGINKLRLYVAANNLITLTEYRGYDPTASTGSPIGGGIDYGFYPNPKTFLFGLNLNF